MTPLMAGPAERYVPGRRPHFEPRTAAVQTSLRSNCLRTIVAAFTANANIRKIRTNVMAVGDFDRRPYADVDVWFQVNREVASRCLKLGIVMLAVRRDKLRDDPAATGFRARRWHSIQFNAAPARLRANRPFGRSEPNTSAARLHFYGTADIAEIDTSSTRTNLHASGAALHLNAASAGLQHRAL